LITFLDRMIARLTAQRACLNWAFERMAALPGPVLEFGLGNGRSYDHLRSHLKDRNVYVFDARVAAHPACIPPPERVILGDFRDTTPALAGRFENAVALIHGDIGSYDAAASQALAAELAPHWARMLRDGALLVSDQPLAHSALAEVVTPPEAAQRYYIYQRRGRQQQPGDTRR
jgi:S-adenosyl-L-methionine methyltransferase